MSIAGYFGCGGRDLRLGLAEFLDGLRLEDGKEAVEDRRVKDELRLGAEEERYQDVLDYDPVLRSHCRF